jgi:rhodanese-related sulfurtransferase
MGRKPGVASPEELAAFVADAGDNLIVLDVRNADFSLEPGVYSLPRTWHGITTLHPPNACWDNLAGDKASNEKAPLGDPARARAINCIFDRSSGSMDLSLVPQDWIDRAGGKYRVPVITHCGGGGRGQKAKEYLEAAGFKNVKNGGGPEDTECWKEFGHK